MSTISVNDARAIVASITLPYYGAWSADVALAESTEIPDSVVVSIGDLTILGTVVRRGSFAGSRTLRIVGGFGGWRKTLPARGYAHLAGVRLSTVLSDVAREAGERIVTQDDIVVGTHYARERAKAERVLNLLLDGRWWVDLNGVTQVSERSGSSIVTPFTVVSWVAGKGQFEIATESIAPWQPGRTFTAPNAPGTHTISSVTIEADNDGKLRLHVLTTEGQTERTLTSLRSIVRAEVARLSYAAVYEYTIAPSLGLGLVSTVDCTPTDDRMPPLTRVPLFGIGVIAAPIAGTRCRIRFVNADPGRPECIAIGDQTEHVMTTEACALLIYNVLCELAIAQPGAFTGVVVQPLVAAAIVAALGVQGAPAPPGIIAQAAASAAQSGNFASGTPATTSAPFSAAIAALPAKTLDVSGLFPGVGVPNG